MVSLYGQRTALVLDGSGYLATVTNSATEAGTLTVKTVSVRPERDSYLVSGYVKRTNLGKTGFLPNKNNCVNACAIGGPAIEAFCRVIRDPGNAQQCWAATLQSEAACMSMCSSIF